MIEDFFVNERHKGALFYSGVEQNVKLTIINSFITCKLIYVDLEADASLNTSTSTRAGTIYMEGSRLGVYSEYNRYQNCYNTSEGGVFFLVAT